MVQSASKNVERDDAVKGRTLVLCFDGTDEAYSGCNTNVVRIFSLLKKDDPTRQLVYYQAGIGTYVAGPEVVSRAARWVAKTLDLAVAFSIDSHIMSGYRFLTENWVDGDRICMFGFSRGAYTARALAGMIYQVGLLPKGMNEEVPFAYNIYRHQKSSAAYKADFSRTISIEFIGVFDTVASVGALIPRILPFSSDNHILRTFRHAISLDERRAAFEPQPWERSVDPPDCPVFGVERADVDVVGAAGVGHELGRRHVGALRTLVSEGVKGAGKLAVRGVSEARAVASMSRQKMVADLEARKVQATDVRVAARPPPQRGPSTDVKEVYFAGCHTDIGGGADLNGIEHSLAYIPLRWMIKEILIAPGGAGILWNEDDPRFEQLGIVLHPDGKKDEEGISVSPARVQDQSSSQSPPFSMQKYRHLQAPTTSTAHTKDVSGATTVYDTDHERDALAPASSVPPVVKAHPFVEPDDAPSSHLPVDTRREDMLAPIHDALKSSPGWWFIEFLPFVVCRQDERDRWRWWIRFNLFRPRTITPPPSPTLSINSDASPDERGANISGRVLFHVSVKERMEAARADLRQGNRVYDAEERAARQVTRVRGDEADSGLRAGQGEDERSGAGLHWWRPFGRRAYTPAAWIEGGSEPVFVR